MFNRTFSRRSRTVTAHKHTRHGVYAPTRFPVRPRSQGNDTLTDELRDTPEEMQWLKDVHIPSLDLTRYHSALLFGSEDAPDRIEVYESESPGVRDRPVVYFPAVSGVEAGEELPPPRRQPPLRPRRRTSASVKRTARAKTHKDVEFAVDDAGGSERIFRTFDEACGFAVAISASGKGEVNVDVLISSKSGAAWWGGDSAVEEYMEDPDASVSDRIVIAAEATGRVY